MAYINNIRSTNRITYDERSNLPDYFLTDAVGNEGWNVRLVIPYDISGAVSPPAGDGCACLIRKFVQCSGTVTPYSKDKLQYPNGYYISCCSSGTVPCGYNNGSYKLSVASADEYTRIDSCGYNSIVRNRIKAFSDEREYSYNEVNNEFLRRLKLNSRYIWRHKGTIDGIDMILGMFGLRNKSFNDKLIGTCKYDANNYDYQITEYIAEVSGGTTSDTKNSNGVYRIDWINSTKTITYDYRSVSNYNRDSIDVDYLPYQGLPVVYQQTNATTRKLYPNFSKLEQYDGNPYFQMNGGWQDKAFKYNGSYYSFQFDVDDNIVYSTNGELFKETVRNIRRFDTLQDMLSVPSYEITNGQIVYVSYIQDNIGVLDGIVYNIKRDRFGKYIELIKSNGVVRAGDDLFFDDIIRVYDRNGNISTVNINEIPNGQPINCYIVNGTIQCYDDIKHYDTFDVINTNASNYTNYFTIADFSQSNRLYNATHASGGWRRLSLGETRCKMINTIVNDNNGNNPHNGMMVYDNGREYFKYYEQLFKYSIENDMFDERCYDNFENTLTEISNYGFRFKKKNNDYGVKDYYYESSKIANYTNGNKNVISNNILNTKVIKITFKLHKQLFSDGQGDCEMKYIDDIVMNYLTQMIPSTAILQIRYTN